LPPREKRPWPNSTN